jgi:magnesium transporter
MIEITLYRKDGGFEDRVRLSDVDRIIDDEASLLWIDATAPTAEEIERLQEELKLHPLVVEDLTRRNERARVVQWPGMYSIVFYAVRVEGEPPRVQLQQINLVIARHFVLTVHQEPIVEVEEVVRRWRAHTPGAAADAGIPVYSLLDTLIDGYFPCLDRIADRIEEMEDQVFSATDTAAPESLFTLKKDLIAFRRVVAPERDVVNVLLRREQAVFADTSVIYFQDLYDHLVRIIDTIDTYRDLLSSAMDTYLSVVSNRFAQSSIQLSESANRLNMTMQVLASWSIILMGASLIPSIYGMNFEHMPEIDSPYGYFGAIVAMLTVGGLLIAYFRRKRWL